MYYRYSSPDICGKYIKLCPILKTQNPNPQKQFLHSLLYVMTQTVVCEMNSNLPCSYTIKV